MKVRTLKVLALTTASGFLLQIAGCGGIIADLIINQVITKVLVRVLDAVLGNNDTGTTE